ncbi:alpha/beta hydrolase [Vibrio sp. TH_r3]|uniref:alpha/beta hydrolase n=1 Tax=Vibrio sp. TH_r3 TaxID=3082084 RepID=UPI002955D7C8|nr:alpha/beta hydrolase [Vibrio sp. TH_r3]MDV7105535.1 alpha/beta hydrolase [Vibrio sp. TH_r3]
MKVSTLIAIATATITLLSLPTYAAKTPLCPEFEFSYPLLSGEQIKPNITKQNPFTVMTHNPDSGTIIWLTDQTDNHGLYTITAPAAPKATTIIATSCAQLTPELEISLQATRHIISSPIAIAPSSHFVDDLGLSFDQIAEIQYLAYTLGKKSQPDELYETVSELADNIALAPTLSTSRSSAEKAFHVQTVYYATTRSPVPSEHFYGSQRDTKDPIHFGQADISIPKNHQKGQVEQPLLSVKWLKQADKHVLIQSVTELQADQFWSSLPIHSGVGVWENSMIVYIHGYNVAFSSAIKRTAQMAYDFDYSGVPMLFSWPSNASLLGYASDREDAIWSATYLAQFLVDLKNRFSTANIHIVAHSMGNQVLLNALNELSLQDAYSKVEFGSIILAAPDVDSEWFTYQLAPRISKLSKNWAIYTSANDGALMASEKVNEAKRLGMPVSLANNFDVIDTSDLNAAPWSIPESHSYYANKLPVIEDLVKHLEGLSPKERLLEQVESANGIYWKIEDESNR